MIAFVRLQAKQQFEVSIRLRNVRFDVRKTLLHLAACVLEDLQRGLCNLFIIHLQATQKGLKSLC